MKRLIINADDFGPNPEVSEAILQCLDSKCISSISTIVNIPDPHKSLERLKNTGLGCGIHLNIYSGSALAKKTSIPTLLDADGQFLKFATAASMEEALDPADVYIEFSAQLDILRNTGITVTHIDNHRPELYFAPRIFEQLVRLAKETQLPLRMPFNGRAERYLQFYSAALKMDLQDLRDRMHRSQVLMAGNNLKSPDEFRPEFLMAEPSRENYIRILDDLAHGTSELCTHPSLTGKGKMEMLVLKEFTVERLRSEFSIELIGYADL